MNIIAKYNIDVTEAEMNDLFNPDGPEQEHLSDQGFVELITTPEILEVEEDDNDIAYVQHPKCLMFKHTEARIIFVKCLHWMRFQLEATFTNNNTLLQVREIATKNHEVGLNTLTNFHK